MTVSLGAGSMSTGWLRFADQAPLSGRLGGMPRLGVSCGHSLVRLRCAGPQFRPFTVVAQRIGILARIQGFTRQCQRGVVKQIRCAGILQVELVRTTEKLVCRQRFTQLGQHCAVRKFS